MSIIFGICKPEADPALEQQIRRLSHATETYALDGTFLEVGKRVAMGFQPYYTDEHSRLERQPLTNMEGDMVVIDGRLDNGNDLCAELDLEPGSASGSPIVLTAFKRWGSGCFSRFVGDWALALWSQKETSLYLVRDHAGTRSLYYEISGETVVWATYLETFFVDNQTRELDRAFAIRYLAAEPTRDSTPYRGIRSVTPAHYLKISGRQVTQRSHWTSRIREQIHYRNDAEYAEHFLCLFKQSVARRTGPGAPILAELSGGMDSTAIVCISDHMRKQQGASPSDFVDTVSYYDDSEPDWNEKPFFTAVERYRGKTGIHIDVSRNQKSYQAPDGVYLQPGPDGLSLDRERAFEEQVKEGKYRVILSGIGGDELLGGPPNPFPELADYSFKGQFRTFISQSFSWSLETRTPLIHTLAHTALFVRKLYPAPTLRSNHAAPWIRRHEQISSDALDPEDLRRVSFGYLPSAVDDCITWWNILETLPHRYPNVLHRREYRYPYLDRDLVDYLLRVPRSQLLMPGRRRHLMRSALKGIVPNEILERRRKAFVSRGPLVELSRDQERIAALFHDPLLGGTDLVNVRSLQSALSETDNQSLPKWLRPIQRAVQLELWLKRRSRAGTSRDSAAFHAAIGLCVERR